jgi:hypothetical protein
MMTRKDYIKTSNILKGFADEIHPQVFEDLVEEFAQYFQADNEKFEKACGIDELGLIPA